MSRMAVQMFVVRLVFQMEPGNRIFAALVEQAVADEVVVGILAVQGSLVDAQMLAVDIAAQVERATDKLELVAAEVRRERAADQEAHRTSTVSAVAVDKDSAVDIAVATSTTPEALRNLVLL